MLTGLAILTTILACALWAARQHIRARQNRQPSEHTEWCRKQLRQKESQIE